MTDMLCSDLNILLDSNSFDSQSLLHIDAYMFLFDLFIRCVSLVAGCKNVRISISIADPGLSDIDFGFECIRLTEMRSLVIKNNWKTYSGQDVRKEKKGKSRRCHLRVELHHQHSCPGDLQPARRPSTSGCTWRAGKLHLAGV